MRERIIGVEQEYSLNFIPGPGDAPLGPAELSEKVVTMARETFGQAGGGSHFWNNGGKLYDDRGHPEWASPECRSAREALLYDRAGDLIIGRTAEVVEARLRSTRQQGGSKGTIFAAKNNVDAHGTTFGSHENYLVARNTKVVPDSDEFFNYLARVLVPFLVSRTIISGNGHVRDGFQISQRASHISLATSLDTVESRPIINTRDEPHADEIRYRRLHLILGDANMAEWATFLKLGTTSLVLGMAEDVFLDSLPELSEPVSALWSISKDPTLKVPVPMRNGRTATAIEIQRWYLNEARRYFDSPDEEEEGILERWDQVLSELEREPKLTVGKLDWTTKKDLLERRMSGSYGWDHIALKALDFEYHSLRNESSWYGYLLAAGLMERIVQPEEVEDALKAPPAFTRARTRSMAMRHGAIPRDWAEFGTREGRRICVDDPFDWAPADLFQRMGIGADDVFKWLADGCDRGSVEVQTQAIAALPKLTAVAPSSNGLRSAICIRLNSAIANADWRIRVAAVNAMSAFGRSLFDGPLRQATLDVDYRVRFAAQSALTGGL